MNDDTTIYTATMARIYAGQGHFEKAARIYRNLLDRSPDRDDLKASLNEVEAKLNETRQSRHDRLVKLIGQWITLVNATKTIERLRSGFKNIPHL